MNPARQIARRLRGSRPLTLVLATLGVFTLGLATGRAVSVSGGPAAGPGRPVAASVAKTAPARSATAVETTYADLVAAVAPAVVTVRSERVVRSAAAYEGPLPDDPFFRQFFGVPRGQGELRPRPRVEGALGSGVIVSADGYILTNHHVIDGATEIKVDLPDRRSFGAKLIGSDAPSDLAVLKIDARDLPMVRIGDSERVRVGDVVLALGNPLGVGQTVTMGIISAKGRATGLTDGGFEDFLQTDAPINEGNSGGALVNTDGELVGINSQILTPSGGNIGIGFAIPASMAQRVMQQLIHGGVVHRAMLGVTVQPMTSELAQSVGLAEVKGALVASVQPGSPAMKAGIEPGDVILDVNGRPVNDSNGLRNQIAGMEPGSRVAVVVARDGREQTLHPVLTELPSPKAASTTRADGGAQDLYGLAVEPVTPEIASRLGLKRAGGVVVDEVAPGSVAFDAGIRAGDVIRQVNRKPVTSDADLREALRSSGQRPALVLVEREGTPLYVAVAPHAS